MSANIKYAMMLIPYCFAELFLESVLLLVNKDGGVSCLERIWEEKHEEEKKLALP